MKSVFWTFFSWNYSVGTLAWAAALTIPLIFQGAKRGFRLKVIEGRSCWLYFFYFFICFISSFFSNIPAIFYSLILLIPLLHNSIYTKRIDFFLSAASGILGALVITLLVMLAFGVGDLSSRETSIEIGPNTVGITAALSTYLSYRAGVVTQRALRVFWLISAAFSLFILFLTLSKTSIAALLIALIFSTKPLRNLSAIKLFPAITIALVTLLSYGPILYNKIESGELTFTGRTLLWKGILDYASGWSTLVGNGYNSSKEITQEIGLDIFQVASFTQAHNAYLEAYLNTGMLGLAAIIGIIFTLAKKYFLNSDDTPSFITARGIFIILLVRSLMEASITQPGSSESLLFFSIFLLACQKSASTIATSKRDRAGHAG